MDWLHVVGGEVNEVFEAGGDDARRIAEPRVIYKGDLSMAMVSELDPQVKVLLEQSQATATQHPAPDHILTINEKMAALRQAISASAAALGIPSEGVAKVEDFNIPGPAGEMPVRLYVPHMEEPLAAAIPSLLYYPGGSFVGGDLETHDTLLRALANRARCLVVSVAYRLAPENRYPTANADAWAALAWFAEHASEIGADPLRLAVGGDSAGGLLAAWVAQKAAKSGPRLRVQMLLYPALDLTFSRPSWKELGSGAYFISRADMMELCDAYLPPGINREDSKVSPLFATDLTGIAPALIITAEYDPIRDEGNEYAAKLKAANVAVDHTCWPGMVHGFALMAGVLDAGKLLIDQTGAALRKAFE